jgi:Family of unknown function (DUF5681)
MGKRRDSKTDNTNAQQKPWLFKPGQSGNPAGRPKGSRNKLAEDFLADAYHQWRQHGSKALETMATSEPAKFCQMVAGLLPKESVVQDERVQLSEIKLVIVDAKDNHSIKTIQPVAPEMLGNETRSLTDARQTVSSLISPRSPGECGGGRTIDWRAASLRRKTI